MLSFNYKTLGHHSKPYLSLRLVCAYLFTLLLFAVLWAHGHWGGQPPSHEKISHCSNQVEVHVPDNVKIVGLVFYGRREFVEILDCYLKVGWLLSVLRRRRKGLRHADLMRRGT